VSATDLVLISIRSLKGKPSQNYLSLSYCGWTDQNRPVWSVTLPFPTAGGRAVTPADCIDLWPQTAEWHPVQVGLRQTVQTHADIWEARGL